MSCVIGLITVFLVLVGDLQMMCYDYLAIRTMVSRGLISGVGLQIGVGKVLLALFVPSRLEACMCLSQDVSLFIFSW